jgi:hypothetical protein
MYEIVDISWTELKHLHQSSGDRQIIGNYTFPDLHAFSDPVVTKKVTQVIRDNFPKGCPEESA